MISRLTILLCAPISSNPIANNSRHPGFIPGSSLLEAAPFWIPARGRDDKEGTRSRVLTIRAECSRLDPHRTESRSERWRHRTKIKSAPCSKASKPANPAAVAVVNEAKYVQHNPQTRRGQRGAGGPVQAAVGDKSARERRPRLRGRRFRVRPHRVRFRDPAHRVRGVPVRGRAGGGALGQHPAAAGAQRTRAAAWWTGLTEATDLDRTEQQPRIRAEFCGKCAGRRPDQPTGGISSMQTPSPTTIRGLRAMRRRYGPRWK